MTSVRRSSETTRRARSVSLFVTFLRWATALFAVASVAATAVLAVRAPDCIAIGVSVLRGKDCTNRETYYLLLAASVAACLFFSLLLFVSAYALDLLGVIAFDRNNDRTNEAESSRQ